MKGSYRKVENVDLHSVKNLVTNECCTKWAEELTKYSKLDFLVQIISNFGVENYLAKNLDRYDKSLLSQLRYGILPLELETGRYKGLDRGARLCTLCNSNVVEDQLHFVLQCPVYNDFRSDFVNTCRERITGWDNLTDIQKISNLFEKQPILFGKFIRKTFVYRKSLLFN